MNKANPGFPLIVAVAWLLAVGVGCVSTSKYELEVAHVATLEAEKVTLKIRSGSLFADLEAIRTELADLKTLQAKLTGKHEFTKSKLVDSETRIDAVKRRLHELLSEFSSYKLFRDRESEDLKTQWSSVQDNLLTLDARIKEVNVIFGEITAKMEILAASKNEQILAGEMAMEAERERVDQDGLSIQPPQSLGGKSTSTGVQ